MLTDTLAEMYSKDFKEIAAQPIPISYNLGEYIKKTK